MQNVASLIKTLIRVNGFTTFLINYRYIVERKSKKKAEFGIIKTVMITWLCWIYSHSYHKLCLLFLGHIVLGFRIENIYSLN